MIKVWDRKFGGSNFDIFSTFKQTSDGGYILFGYTESSLSGEVSQSPRGAADYWMVKTDSDGNKKWDRRFGGAEIDRGIEMEQTLDNGFIFGGYSLSDTSIDKSALRKGYIDFWVIRTDSNGTKLWDKCYGGLSLAGFELRDLIQTSDGGFILGGATADGVGGDCTYANWDTSLNSKDFWIIKIDAFGNKLWDRKFGGTNNDEFGEVVECQNGGFLIGGTSWSDADGDKSQPSQGISDAWIVKTDMNGNKLWDKRFGGSQWETLYSLKSTTDGGFLLGVESSSPISGDKTIPSNGNEDFWIVKIDSLGTKIWDNGYGGSGKEELISIATDGFGNIYISGDSYSQASGDKSENNLGVEQSWIVKTDSTGILLWEKTIGTPGHDEQAKILISEDGCITVGNCSDANIGGLNSHPSRGMWDFWMVKLCDSTAVTALPDWNITDIGLNVYPNPSHEFLTVLLDSFKNNLMLQIVDVMGRTVHSSTINAPEFAIDISGFSSGIYSVVVQSHDNEIRGVKAFVKQ